MATGHRHTFHEIEQELLRQIAIRASVFADRVQRRRMSSATAEHKQSLLGRDHGALALLQLCRRIAESIDDKAEVSRLLQDLVDWAEFDHARSTSDDG